MPNSPPSYSTRSNVAEAASASKDFPSTSKSGVSRDRSASASSASGSRDSARTTWSRSASSSAAKPSSTGTDGRNTEAVSPRRRTRTNRPIACAKNSAVDTDVAYTPTASRGTSTPSDTIRTATIQRSVDDANAEIFRLAVGSSESTTTGRAPETRRSSAAYARAVSWSPAITRPAASGIARRTSVRRRSAASSTRWIHSPAGSSAVRHACVTWSFVIGVPSVAVISSPALVRQCISPE